MIRRTILFAVGLSLALGCGRRDRPTVRQISILASEKSTANASPSSDDGAAICPGSAAPHRTRPKLDPRLDSGLADAADSAGTSPADLRQPGDPPQIGDANRAKAADALGPYDVGEGVRTLLGIVPAVVPGFAGIGLGQDLWTPKMIDEVREVLATSRAGAAATDPPKIPPTSPPGVAEARASRIEANPARNGEMHSAAAATNPAGTRGTLAARADVSSVPGNQAARRAKPAGRDLSTVDTKEVRMGSMRLVAPKTWMRERPPLDFVLAQFVLPRAKGDPADAQLTVAEAVVKGPKGLERLREELSETPKDASVERLQIGGNEVVLVDSMEEEDSDDGKPSGPSPSPGTEGRCRVLNAVIFLGDKVFFVNCTGPEKTVGERAGEFRSFLQTIKPAGES